MLKNDPNPKFVSFLLLCLSGLLFGGCSLQKQYIKDWPTFQGDHTRLGYAPDGPMPPLELKWKYQTNGRIIFPPVLLNEVLYFGSRDGSLSALNIEDGSVVWQSHLGQGGNFQSPAVDQEILMTGQYALYYFLHAWDPRSGQKRWEYKTGELQNRPPYFAMNGTQVCVNTDPSPEVDLLQIKSRMTCLHKTTGTPIWHKNLAGIPQSQPTLTQTHLLTVTADPSEVLALDLATGKELWQYTLAGTAYTAPVLDLGKQRVYLATDTGFVYALELETGKLAWRYQYPNARFQQALALSENYLLLPDDKGILYAFDVKDLAPLWQYRAPQPLTTPIATREHIYVGCQNRMLYVLDRKTGGFRWFFRTGDAILGSPILSQNQLFFGSSDGILYALKEREANKTTAQTEP